MPDVSGDSAAGNAASPRGEVGTRPVQYASDRYKREESPHQSETAHSTLPPPLSVVDNKYRVDAELGRGGMGAVYRAQHVALGKSVALKWLLPELANDQDSRQRFLREARAASNIKHENVVDVYDFGIDSERGVPYIVMEYLTGMPLSAHLEQQKRLDVRETLDIMIQCMRGVGAAHKLGIVHRDLKPENIFLCEGDEPGSYRVKVLDFGVAAALEPKTDESIKHIITRTASRNVVGTVFYMSAEQLAGGVIDARVDVYACGVIFYELLNGKPPFTGHSYNELAMSILDGNPVPLTKRVPGLDPALWELVQRAMAPRMTDRFSTMSEAVQAFQQYRKQQLRSVSISGAVPTHAAQSARAERSIVQSSASALARVDRRIWLGAGALIVVLVGLLIALTTWRAHEQEPERPAALHEVRPKPPAAESPAVEASPPPAGLDQLPPTAAEDLPVVLPPPEPAPAAPSPKREGTKPSAERRKPVEAQLAPARQQEKRPAAVPQPAAPAKKPDPHPPATAKEPKRPAYDSNW